MHTVNGPQCTQICNRIPPPKNHVHGQANHGGDRSSYPTTNGELTDWRPTPVTQVTTAFTNRALAYHDKFKTLAAARQQGTAATAATAAAAASTSPVPGDQELADAIGPEREWMDDLNDTSAQALTDEHALADVFGQEQAPYSFSPRSLSDEALDSDESFEDW